MNSCKRVKEKSRAKLLKPKAMDKKSVGIPFVVIYHAHLKNIIKIIKKHIKHLYADPEVRSVFTPLPFVSFRSVQNLRITWSDLNYIPRNGK